MDTRLQEKIEGWEKVVEAYRPIWVEAGDRPPIAKALEESLEALKELRLEHIQLQQDHADMGGLDRCDECREQIDYSNEDRPAGHLDWCSANPENGVG